MTRRGLRRWTPFEDECVRLCYGCADLAVLSSHLNRSVQAVMSRHCDVGHTRRFRLASPSRKRYRLELAQECATLNVGIRQAIAGYRRFEFVLARARVFSSLRSQGFSFPGIGRAAGKDHSTIIHALNNLEHYERKIACVQTRHF